MKKLDPLEGVKPPVLLKIVEVAAAFFAFRAL